MWRTDVGAHHACWLLLQALFMTASVLTVTSTTATRTMTKGLFMVTWRARHRGRAGLEVETQRHSQVAQETSAAKDVTPVVATAADTNKTKHHKHKVFARQRDNYGYWNARGYAQRGFFFR